MAAVIDGETAAIDPLYYNEDGTIKRIQMTTKALLAAIPDDG